MMLIFCRQYLLFILVITAIYKTQAQQSKIIPFNYSTNYVIEKNYFDKDCTIHSFVKPFLASEVNLKLLADSTPRNKYHLNALPILNSYAGVGSSKNIIYDATIGTQVNIGIGKKIFLNLTAIAGNTSPINYIDSFTKNTNIIPGFGYSYGNNGNYNYAQVSGNISYSPNKIFNFQLGKDKLFWGNGYRSLFLSDYANNYPYALITTKIWKLKYTIMYNWMQDASFTNGIVANNLNKYGVYHYLSWNINKRINVGFFESIIWQGTNASRNRGYEFNYINPVIFFRPVEYSIGSGDNALIGASATIKLFKKQQFYTQVIIDEFLLSEVVNWNKGWWGNKQGIQIGYKCFDAFHIKNLYAQAEFNYVRPHTYAHGSAQQNYGHYNQALAHPLGANFTEALAIIRYQHKRIHAEAKAIYAVYGKDTSITSFGQNIFKSYFLRAGDYNQSTAQGLKTNMLWLGANCSYLVYPKYNVYLEAGAFTRIESNSLNTLNSSLFYVGIKTNLNNKYWEF